MATNSEIEELLLLSIEAQNRTTYAVRAIATYILIQIPYALLGGLLITTGNPQEEILALGAILIVVGFFHALFVALRELARSRFTPSVYQGSSAKSDFDIAEKEMSSKEFWYWSDAGKPNLQEWVRAGKPPYKAWHQLQSTRNANE